MDEIVAVRIFDADTDNIGQFFCMYKKDASLMEKLFSDSIITLREEFQQTFMWLLVGIMGDRYFACPRRLAFEIPEIQIYPQYHTTPFLYFDNAGYIRISEWRGGLFNPKELVTTSLVRIYSSRVNFNYSRNVTDRSLGERVSYGRNYITQMFTYMVAKSKSHIDIDFTKPDDIRAQLEPLVSGYDKKYIIFCEFPYDYDKEVYDVLAGMCLPETINHNLYFLDGDLFERMVYDCQFLVKSPCIYRMSEPLLGLCNK